MQKIDFSMVMEKLGQEQVMGTIQALYDYQEQYFDSSVIR